jgi:hypothetical protein
MPAVRQPAQTTRPANIKTQAPERLASMPTLATRVPARTTRRPNIKTLTHTSPAGAPIMSSLVFDVASLLPTSVTRGPNY